MSSARASASQRRSISACIFPCRALYADRDSCSIRARVFLSSIALCAALSFKLSSSALVLRSSAPRVSESTCSSSEAMRAFFSSRALKDVSRSSSICDSRYCARR